MLHHTILYYTILRIVITANDIEIGKIHVYDIKFFSRPAA
jgi:hypothetical protein